MGRAKRRAGRSDGGCWEIPLPLRRPVCLGPLERGQHLGEGQNNGPTGPEQKRNRFLTLNGWIPQPCVLPASRRLCCYRTPSWSFKPFRMGLPVTLPLKVFQPLYEAQSRSPRLQSPVPSHPRPPETRSLCSLTKKEAPARRQANPGPRPSSATSSPVTQGLHTLTCSRENNPYSIRSRERLPHSTGPVSKLRTQYLGAVIIVIF